MTRGLFAYGTLQFPEVMEAVSGTRFEDREGWVSGFAQYRMADRLYPGMIPQQEGVTHGRVYFGVSDMAWSLLDRFEDPVYDRQMLNVCLANGEWIRAHAYILPGHHAHLLSAARWEKDWFRERHLKDYIDRCRWFYHMATLT